MILREEHLYDRYRWNPIPTCAKYRKGNAGANGNTGGMIGDQIIEKNGAILGASGTKNQKKLATKNSK